MEPAEHSVLDLLNLKGKAAVVTGASGWLGSAMSRALAEAGATLAVSSRDAAQAERSAAELPGKGHVGLALNQDDTNTIPGFMGRVIDQLGRVDILVNNAYGHTLPDIDQASADDFDQAYHLGVTAYFLLAREVYRHLMERNSAGSIVNIASMYGVVGGHPEIYQGIPLTGGANYFAMKGGLISLTRHLAVNWAPHGIRVNCISPGPFPRPARSKVPQFIPRLCKHVPLGRVGRAEELKGAVLLLASDAGSYITGQNLIVDGGWTAW